MSAHTKIEIQLRCNVCDSVLVTTDLFQDEGGAWVYVELCEKCASQPAQDDHINSAVKHIGDVDDMPPLVKFMMHPEGKEE